MKLCLDLILNISFHFYLSETEFLSSYFEIANTEEITFKVLVKYLAQVKVNIQQSKKRGILTFIPSVKISP